MLLPDDPMPTGSLDSDAHATTLVGVDGCAEPSRPSARPITIGRYVVLEVIGEGGMGIVYAAFDPRLGRRVAVKVLHSSATRRLPINAHPRLLREARALARLAHPNVVAVYDAGLVDADSAPHGARSTPRAFYVAMELVEGIMLGAWRAGARRTWREIVAAYADAGRGLAAAHDGGLVHRDFKPDNAIVDAQGRVRVLDFGLAIAPDDGDDTEVEVDSITASSRLTMTGVVMGTPAYMAPEQLAGDGADARSDQFSFCVALYEALYGLRPYRGRTVRELAQATRSEIPRPPDEGDVPRWVLAALQRGLACDPAARWPDLRALLAALDPARRRRRRHLFVAGATVVAGALAVQARAADTQAPCTAAAERLDAVWNAARRQEVKQALAATELSYASETWTRVAAGLDAYAGAWVIERRDACLASREGAAQSEADLDRRMQCLDDRLASLSAVVDVLADADAEVVGNAVAAVTRLPRLSRCRDLAALGHATALPADPEQARQVEAIRAEIAAARALETAGKYAAGLATAESAVRRARAVDHGATLAEALAQLGALRERTGAWADAEAALEEAALLASELGHDEVAGRAMSQLVGVVGYLQARHDDGLWWSRHAETALRRARLDPLSHAQLANNIGAVLYRMGDYAGALARYEEARTLVDDSVDAADRQELASTLNNLGNAHAMAGQFAEAETYLAEAVADLADLRGEGHPTVALVRANLANAQLDRGHVDDAERNHRRALDDRRRAHGESHPLVASSYMNLGLTLATRGDFIGARPYLERAVRIKEDTVGAEHPDVALALNNLGETLRNLGEHDAAIDVHARAKSIWSTALGAEHPYVAYPTTNLGLDHLEAGRLDAAREQLERALQLRTAHPVEPAILAVTKLGLARVLVAQGAEPERARALAADAEVALRGGPARYADDHRTALGLVATLGG